MTPLFAVLLTLSVAADEPILVRPGDVVRVNSTTFWDVMDVLAPLAGVSALRYTLK